MLLRLLRILAFGLAIYFIYRLIVQTIAYLRGEHRRDAERRSERTSEHPSQKSEPPRDIRDAEYRDLPEDPKKPS